MLPTRANSLNTLNWKRHSQAVQEESEPCVRGELNKCGEASKNKLQALPEAERSSDAERLKNQMEEFGNFIKVASPDTTIEDY